MRVICGIIIILIGIALGAFLGIWVCLVGGIIQLVEACQVSPINATGVAFGIVRILVSGLVGGISFFVISSIGGIMIFSRSKPKSLFNGSRFKSRF